MQSEVTGIVKDVQGKSTKKGTVYEIEFEGGQTVATFKGPLAEKANGLKGQSVKAMVTETTKTADDGRSFTNYYLEEIHASGNKTATVHVPTNGAGSSIPTKTDDAAPRIARAVAFEHLPLYYENDLIPADADPETMLAKFATWIYTGGWTGGNEAKVIAMFKNELGATEIGDDGVATW